MKMRALPIRRTAVTIGSVVTAVSVGAAAAVSSGPLHAAAPEPRTTPESRADAGRCAQPGPYEPPQGEDPVHLDPRNFTTRIDHPYWPMRPGTTWRYVERSEGEVVHVRVRVTARTKVIEGIRARVVHDVARVDGERIEDTRDWYAQDSGGNLWYLGEFSQNFDNGVLVDTAGSWKHGQDGAQAGVILPARPRAGCGYREEYLAGEAEDRARILSVDETLRTPTGLHHQVVQTANTTPLEPDLLENKFYARGIGPVLELDLSPELGRAELVGITRKARSE